MSKIAVKIEEYEIHSLDDEIRVDGLCRDLLLRFYEQLLEEDVEPTAATELARSADYYVRDYLVGYRQKSPFDATRSLVRTFGGTWYVVNTLEPTIGELTRHLEGIRSWYRFLHGHRLVSDQMLGQVERDCSDHDGYRERIRTFWEITGDGYYEWERACSLRDD